MATTRAKNRTFMYLSFARTGRHWTGMVAITSPVPDARR
jgi:hypothetical protein